MRKVSVASFLGVLTATTMATVITPTPSFSQATQRTLQIPGELSLNNGGPEGNVVRVGPAALTLDTKTGDIYGTLPTRYDNKPQPGAHLVIQFYRAGAKPRGPILKTPISLIGLHQDCQDELQKQVQAKVPDAETLLKNLPSTDPLKIGDDFTIVPIGSFSRC